MRLFPLLIVYTLFNTAGLMVLRRALDEQQSPGESLAERLLTPTVFGGGLLYAASFAVWLLTLGKYPVTTVYPAFVGASFVGIALGGWLVLDENVTLVHVFGGLLVLSGIGLLATR